MPAAPEVLTPSQLLTLTALRPLADVLNPQELLTLNDEMPMPLSGFVIVGWNPGVDRLPRRGDGLGSLNIERGFGWWRKADQRLTKPSQKSVTGTPPLTIPATSTAENTPPATSTSLI